MGRKRGGIRYSRDTQKRNVEAVEWRVVEGKVFGESSIPLLRVVAFHGEEAQKVAPEAVIHMEPTAMALGEGPELLDGVDAPKGEGGSGGVDGHRPRGEEGFHGRGA